MKKKEYIAPAISVIAVEPATMIATSWTSTGKEEDGLGVFEEDYENPYDDDSF